MKDPLPQSRAEDGHGAPPSVWESDQARIQLLMANAPQLPMPSADEINSLAGGCE